MQADQLKGLFGCIEMMDVEIRYKRVCGPGGPLGGPARVVGALKPPDTRLGPGGGEKKQRNSMQPLYCFDF